MIGSYTLANIGIGTRMTQILLIYTDFISEYSSNLRHQRSI